MTKEEVSVYAYKPTYYGVQIKIYSSDEILVGCFKNNTPNSEDYHANKWNFTITSTNENIELFGGDIESIDVIND